MKKVSELEGAELDYWAGKAFGLSDRELVIGNKPGTIDEKYVVVYGVNVEGVANHLGPKGHGAQTWSPSTNWAQGGPIIEEYHILIGYDYINKKWSAHTCKAEAYGDTALIANMRCFVASKLGNEVDSSLYQQITGQLK
jgi:hypothetical protein